MADQTIDELVEDVENELLQVIIKYMDHEQMNEEQASKLAAEFLALLPISDKRDLLAKLKTYSDEHVEAKSVYLKYAKPIEEEERQKKLALMSHHIKNGQIEHALNVAKGVPTNAGTS